MFGKRLHEIAPIREAVATYAARACEKFRAQGSLCRKVRVSIRTGMFNPAEPKFAKGVICELPYPSDDTRLIIRAVIEGLELAGLPGVLRLQQGRGAAARAVPAQRVHSKPVRCRAGDESDGPDQRTLGPWHPAAGQHPDRARLGWRELMSQSFTTRLDELWRVGTSR